MDEIAYNDLTGVELMWKPSHPMMILGTVCVIAAIFLSLTGLILHHFSPSPDNWGCAAGIGCQRRPGILPAPYSRLLSPPVL